MSQINKPSEYFNTKLYTGNGSTNNITGVGFQPDWVWVKRRDSTSDHTLGDSVRGTGKKLFTSLNILEVTDANFCSSFDSDGFTVAGTAGDYNGSGATYASWNWLGGGTASSNTDGSITSQVSANTTSGFSIVSYTGTGSAGTIGHGLGATPAMGIFKNRTSGSTNWRVWHQGITNTQILELNATTAAGVPGTADFNISNNTIDVWGLETNSQSNGSGDDMIAYIFAEKKGFSKFGSYTGNGNADGTFVYTGFKPAMIIKKRSNNTGNWQIEDNKRNTFNVVANTLLPDSSNAEDSSSAYDVDFLSNGFKLRATNTHSNGSGDTYIYMAFAENPLVTSTGIPATAR